MMREEPRFEYVLPRQVPEGWNLGWDYLAGCDAVFLQRPCLDVHLQYANQVKAMGLPLWVDWDDDLSCIPRSNPKRGEYYAWAQEGKLMQALAELADVVTVSTDELARRLRHALGGDARGKVRVLPNAYHGQKFYVEPRARVVSWRGSETHEEDVCSVLPQMANVAQLPQFSKWAWAFIGHCPWQVHSCMPGLRLRPIGGVDVVFFQSLLGHLAPWVHIVPLQPNPFNRAKSNVAWLEATGAGAVVIAPDWEEWQRPGIINYKDPGDFERRLRETIEAYNGDQPHGAVRDSRRYIEEHLMLPQVNQKRWQILNEMLKI